MMVKGQGRSSEEQMEDECVQHCWGRWREGKESRRGGQWAMDWFYLVQNELKPIEERMHVKIIYTPKRIRGKNSNSISRYF